MEEMKTDILSKEGSEETVGLAEQDERGSCI
jgi:hypothetical protein